MNVALPIPNFSEVVSKPLKAYNNNSMFFAAGMNELVAYTVPEMLPIFQD